MPWLSWWWLCCLAIVYIRQPTSFRAQPSSKHLKDPLIIFLVCLYDDFCHLIRFFIFQSINNIIYTELNFCYCILIVSQIKCLHLFEEFKYIHSLYKKWGLLVSVAQIIFVQVSTFVWKWNLIIYIYYYITINKSKIYSFLPKVFISYNWCGS